jgi:uncharacterized protein
MSPKVTQRLAESLSRLPTHKQPIGIHWHCGEPLAAGLSHMRELFAPFSELEANKEIVHYIQTNATLIDSSWCDFFAERGCEVAVSLDGPAWANQHRLYFSGAESFSKTIRGIKQLKERGVPLVVLAVVTEENLDKAELLYEFFAELGCQRLGINIEERSGINLQRPMIKSSRVSSFWQDLYKAYRKNPVVHIREFRFFANWWKESDGKLLKSDEADLYRINYFLTVGYNGDVVFLSPEFLQANSGKYKRFEVGNILEETLGELVNRAKTTDYVLDFLTGQEACKAECRHYSFCGGGYANNKFFELGSTAGTQTLACLNTRKRLFDVLHEEMMRASDEAGGAVSASEQLLPR